MGIGALLRCYHVNVFPGLNPDEVEIALQWFRDHPIYWYVAPSGRPHVNPLGPILLWPFAMFASPAPWVVRMPAVLAGLALLPVTLVVMRRAFGRSAALLATLLVSSAPILIAYSRLGWDPAFVPLLTALAVGFAFERRWGWASASLLLLALIHPTAAFVLPLVAAPIANHLWCRASGSRHLVLQRVGLGLASGTSYAVVVLVILASVEEIPLRLENVPELFRLVSARLGDGQGAAEFASGYWHALEGSLIYVGFLGGHVPPATIWPAIVLSVVAAAGVYLLWRQGRFDEVTIVAALLISLLAQYLAQGTEAASELHERYLLWAAVPSCLALGFMLQAFFAWLGAPGWAPVVALGLSVFWMESFYTSYLRPFERQGGTSAVLDYRSAVPQPREQVLRVIRSHRQYPATAAKVFVGESRLDLGLVYLASRDDTLDIRNLGRMFYGYYQRDDQPDLLRSYEEYASTPRDVFFVDYAWENLEGSVQENQVNAGRPVAAVVTPWTAYELQTVRTTDGRPLLRVWRLSRPS